VYFSDGDVKEDVNREDLALDPLSPHQPTCRMMMTRKKKKKRRMRRRTKMRRRRKTTKRRRMAHPSMSKADLLRSFRTCS
jgi:hypothetical protein